MTCEHGIDTYANFCPICCEGRMPTRGAPFFGLDRDGPTPRLNGFGKPGPWVEPTRWKRFGVWVGNYVLRLGWWIGGDLGE